MPGRACESSETKLITQPGEWAARASDQQEYVPEAATAAVKHWIKTAAVASCSAAINLLSWIPRIFLRGEYQPSSSGGFVSSEAWMQQYRVWEEKRHVYLPK